MRCFSEKLPDTPRKRNTYGEVVIIFLFASLFIILLFFFLLFIPDVKVVARGRNIYYKGCYKYSRTDLQNSPASRFQVEGDKKIGKKSLFEKKKNSSP